SGQIHELIGLLEQPAGIKRKNSNGKVVNGNKVGNYLVFFPESRREFDLPFEGITGDQLQSLLRLEAGQFSFQFFIKGVHNSRVRPQIPPEPTIKAETGRREITAVYTVLLQAVKDPAKLIILLNL